MLQSVTRSAIIDAPIERVWAVLRDFNSHDRWHDVVAESRIEGGESSAQVGCVRSFSLADGNRIREQLLSLDDRAHVSRYCIVEATIPLERYVATVTLKRVTDGDRTFWHWHSTFATPPGRERELAAMVAQGVYEAGFANLRRYLRAGGDLRESRPMPSSPSDAAYAAYAADGRGHAGAGSVPARRVALHAHGEPSVLEAGAVEVPPPGPGEVRIRQRAIGVNYFDIYLRRGWIPNAVSPDAPGGAVLGLEGAGTVLDVGEPLGGAATRFLPGDRVACLYGGLGGYASVRNVPASAVVRLPAGIEDDVAAALLLKGITADVLLRDLGRVGRGTRLLVHAAAGGLGLLVCSWAAHLGATVIGTVSGEAKARVAREHGCAEVVITDRYRFADAVQAACGGADVIVDGLGRAAQDENLQALAVRGHWISVGQASGPLQPVSPDALVGKSATFSRPVAMLYVATAAELQERAERVWRAVEQGALKVPPIERWSLDSARRAHERLESRQTTGAVVLTA